MTALLPLMAPGLMSDNERIVESGYLIVLEDFGLGAESKAWPDERRHTVTISGTDFL